MQHGFYFIAVLTVGIAIIHSTVGEGLVGGQTDEKPATEKIQALVQKLQPEIQDKIVVACTAAKPENSGSCEKPSKLEALSYKSQVVAGVNYFVKVLTSSAEYYHVRIFEQSWTKTLEVTRVIGPKNETDKIAYF